MIKLRKFYVKERKQVCETQSVSLLQYRTRRGYRELNVAHRP